MRSQSSPGVSRGRWLLVALWVFLYGSFTLLSPPLMDGRDAYEAQAAQAWLQRGSAAALPAGPLSLPAATPLQRCIAGSMDVFGAGAPQARLPLAACTLLLALMVEAFARRAFCSSRTGVYSACILLLSPALFLSTRSLTPAALVALCYVAAVHGFFLAEDNGVGARVKVLPCLLFAAAVALTALVAGGVAATVPCGTAALYLLLTYGFRGALRRVTALHPLPSLLAFCVVLLAGRAVLSEGTPAASWPGAVHTARWLWQALPTPHPVPARSSLPGVWPWLLLVAGLLPWSGFLPHAAVAALREGKRVSPASARPGRSAALLSAVAAVVPLIAGSCLPGYTVAAALCALPFAGTLVAHWLHGEAAEAEAMAVPLRLHRTAVRVSAGLLAGAILTALGCAALLLHGGDRLAHWAVSFWPNLSGSQRFALERILADVEALRAPLLLCGGSLLAGTLANWQLRRGFQPQRGNMALAAGVLGALTASHMAWNAAAPVFSSQHLAEVVAPMLKPRDRVVIHGGAQDASSFTFYLQRSDITTLADEGPRDERQPLPDGAGPPTWTKAALRQQWLGLDRVFLWTDSANAPALPAKAYVLAESGGKQVLSNKAGPY